MMTRRALRFGLLPALVSLVWPPGGGHPSVAGSGPQERSPASAVPCSVPLEWRIADVDPRFELDEGGAESAMRAAAGLWEGALDREFLSHDPAGGFPVRFEYDDRQALLLARRRFERELREEGERIDARREELDTARQRLESARAEHREGVASYERRMAEHDAAVGQWNERGGAPDSVRVRLRERAAALREERSSLQRRQRDLRELEERLGSEADGLNERIREHNRRAEALERESPVRAAEAGNYAESVTRRDGEVVSVRREIRVFRFEGGDDLVLLLAHELGHALGLGHSGVPGSVMNDVLPRQEGAGLHGRDVEMLRERCPGLAASSGPHSRAR